MQMVSTPLDTEQILTITDDRFLSAFTKKVFQSGFVWRVVEQKWPAFEDEFFGFNIEKILLMPDEMLEKKASNPAIIRNYRKVAAIRDNALMINDMSRQHGSFASFVISYLGGNIIDLWTYLKKHGVRLGGNTGPYALRALGIDTFLLSRDVEGYFRQHKLIEGGLTSKRNLTIINAQFNQWRLESGLPLQSISQIVSLSCGDNSRQIE
ncbi:DNA-3-methyladenine glycosylase I [Alteromonas sediminis]|uniref:DNA-3-methyladenine glycosylase I n=2 Tax=Alteromonas sediminis TaxID=2259342 RepID=A0A3N5XWR4_9ALTE|nr:DNA-3-methyladenine glycosylase I [Alteromonas sediminis]